MTIENLKQIAIKYATTKGSRVPLAPDELCNAVVQYMNSFFGVMTDINTIKVAVTEDSGNIVFTITGNTYDGKPITPIVITVDHNDFVTDQEFEEFKTTTNAAIQKNTESINSLSFRVEDTENDITTIQVQVGQINTRVGNTETNIAEINSTLENKVDVIKIPASNFVVYAHIDKKDENVSFTENAIGNTIPYRRAIDGGFNVAKGTSGQNAANMENIADVEAKIPSITNLADVTKENTFTNVNHFTQHITTFGVEVGVGNENDDEYDISIQEYGIEIFHYISDSKANSLRITENQIMTIVYPSNEYNIFDFPNKSGTLALTSDIPDTSSFVTLAGDNTFGGTNTFNNSISAKNGVVAGDTTNYGANSVTKGSNTYSFPNKSGTFAMTTDIIKNPIYFISFYANDPSEPCHLIGTMMSKNSYGTGQKNNEEFAVMLADNLYTNSNEGLAAYGKLAGKDILCIYSEDGLSIRCLDEANSEVDLPTVMFFVMETEL